MRASPEKFFTVGGIVIPMAINAIFLILKDQGDISVPGSALSSVLSILMFVACYVVFKVKDSLPKRVIEERKMKKHLKTVAELANEETNM